MDDVAFPTLERSQAHALLWLCNRSHVRNRFVARLRQNSAQLSFIRPRVPLEFLQHPQYPPSASAIVGTAIAALRKQVPIAIDHVLAYR